MRIVHVNKDECSDPSWRKLQEQHGHQRRDSQDVVRRHAENDHEPEARHQARLHYWMTVYSLEKMFCSWVVASIIFFEPLSTCGLVSKLSKAKVHVCSDSVLGMEKMHGYQEVKVKWKEKLPYFQESNAYIELFGIDGNHFHRTSLDNKSLQVSEFRCSCKSSRMFDRSCVVLEAIRCWIKEYIC